jgi:hypothetical protein
MTKINEAARVTPHRIFMAKERETHQEVIMSLFV